MGRWYGLILASVVILALFGAGCLGERSGSGPAPAGSPPAGQVLQVVGEVTGQGVIPQGVPRGIIDTVTFSVGLVPGAKSVNIENLSIVYSDALRSETLSPAPGFRGSPPVSSWGVIRVNNEVGNPNNRLDYEEQFVIRINPKSPVVPNQVITISVKPQEGNPVIIRLLAPATIAENDNILFPL
jgi:archaellin